MKRMSICSRSHARLLNGCADPLEQRTTQEVQGQFERGVTGQGTLGPLERPAGDPACRAWRPTDSSVACAEDVRQIHALKNSHPRFRLAVHASHSAANP
jgi:hypothetical protein